MYTMRDVDAYWINFCFNSWRTNTTSSNLTAFTEQQALQYFTQVLNQTAPFNPAATCSQSIFGYGTCPVPMVNYGLPPASSNYACLGQQLRSATMWLGIAGGIIMVLLMIRGIPAAILFGILFVTFISWIPNNNAATYFTSASPIAGGEARYQYFLKGATVPNVSQSAGMFDFAALANGETWIALITFLYLDFMDATSVMFTLAGMVGDKVPGFRDEKGAWPRQASDVVLQDIS